MAPKQISCKVLKTVLLLTIIAFIPLAFEPLLDVSSAEPAGVYSYEFIVDKDGFTIVNIVYRTERKSGSSWVFVPKFDEWTNLTTAGKMTGWTLRNTEDLVDGSYYFYQALYFSFKSDGAAFELNIQFNLSAGAIIIEPNGIFYSSQIGFEKGNKLIAKVILPEGFGAKPDEAIAFGVSGSYRPNSKSTSNSILFDTIPQDENLLRIEVGFHTSNDTADLLELKNQVFTFETVPRYAEYAEKILDLYNKTYDELVDLFNVTLEKATVRFFVPDFNSLLSIGGYVPFSAKEIGDIHINIIFTRYVEGYIEVIALHELVHQFLWKAGVSPRSLLWFHEGMAQYVSIEIASKIGYEGAEMTREELEKGVMQLKETIGENFGFLKQWSPSQQPRDLGSYYIAAYYVIKSLAEPRGNLAYYARFFKLINGERIDGNAALAYYLSLAANESVVEKLNNWGFGIPDLYVYSDLLTKVKQVLKEINPVFQPYKALAEFLYVQGMLNAKQDSLNYMHFYLAAAIFVAKLAPLLTLITVSGVLFGAILWALKAEGVFSNY